MRLVGLAAACAATLAVALAQPAMATPYSMSAGESGVGPINDVQMFLVSGALTGPLVFTFLVDNTNSTTWTLTSHSAGWAEASGPASTDISIGMGATFTQVPFVYDLYILLDGTIIDSAQVTVTGATVADFIALTDAAASYAADLAANAVPEPGSIAMFGAGLVALMPFAGRRQRPRRLGG